MQGTEQQIAQLKKDFRSLDKDNDGYIGLYQFRQAISAQQIQGALIWDIMQVVQQIDSKVSQQNYIIWMMGCKLGLVDLALMSFKLRDQIHKLQPAGPSATLPNVKTSSLNFKVNQQSQSKNSSLEHFLQVQLGINQQRYEHQQKQLNQVLERKPSDIYVMLKLKNTDKGEQIANKISQIVQFGIQMLNQLDPKFISIVQSIKVTSKSKNGYVYLIVELNNTFFNLIFKFLDEAIYTLSPDCNFFLRAKISSDFTTILKQNFNVFEQFINLTAEFLIDGVSLDRIKEKLVEGFQQQEDNQKINRMFLFLLEQINLSSNFQNVKECFQSLGISNKSIPNPATFTSKIKELEIKQLIGQFVPQGNQFLSNLKQYCEPEGQITLNIKSLGAKLKFKLNVEGVFDLL